MLKILVTFLFLSVADWESLDPIQQRTIATEVANRYFKEINPQCKKVEVSVHIVDGNVQFVISCLKQEV